MSTQQLETWKGLNEWLLEANRVDCEKLLAAELTGRKRILYVLRIHSRINKVRAAEERLQLRAECKKKGAKK